jgi:hypothetical protein
VIAQDRAAELVAETYGTLEDAVKIATQLAVGGWQVILGPPYRDGRAFVLARVSHWETGVKLGELRYLE